MPHRCQIERDIIVKVVVRIRKNIKLTKARTYCIMTDYECICKYCNFADCCPSSYFPPDKKVCADLRDMGKGGDNNG